MSYSKNGRLKSMGIVKVDGHWRLPLSGAVIKRGSCIEEWLFEDRQNDSIRITGDYTIEQAGEVLKSDDLVEETEDFFNVIIQGSQVKNIEIDRDFSLKIVIDITPVLTIFVDATGFAYPYEKWTYYTKNEYLTN